MLVYYPNAHSCWGWTLLKPGAWDPSQVPTGEQGPKHLGTLTAFPGTSAQSWKGTALLWDVGASGRLFLGPRPFYTPQGEVGDKGSPGRHRPCPILAPSSGVQKTNMVGVRSSLSPAFPSSRHPPPAGQASGPSAALGTPQVNRGYSPIEPWLAKRRQWA